MLRMKSTLLSIAVAFSVGAASTGFAVHRYMTTKISNVELQHATESAAVIAAAQQNVFAVEQELVAAREAIALNLRNHNAEILAANARFANSAVRLREPNQICPSPMPDDTRAPDGDNGSSGEFVPPQTTQFLWDLASDADGIAARLRACQQWIREITAEKNAS